MNNLRGIALMVVAMVLFAGGDAAIKTLTATLPVAQIQVTIGLIGTLILAAYTRARREALVTRAMAHPALAVRFTAEIVAAGCMSFALKLVPLSLISAVLQATPLVVTLGAALYFREQVGWRRWAAVWLGFAGVLILLRPWSAGFTPETLLPVVAMAALATRDLATRAAPASLSTAQLSTLGFFTFIPAGLLLQVLSPAPIAPDATEWGLLLLSTALVLTGYFALTGAMRVGEISAVAPFRYARLIAGMALGIALFAERPDLWVYVGAGVIVASGLYTFLRERQLARGPRDTLPPRTAGVR